MRSDKFDFDKTISDVLEKHQIDGKRSYLLTMSAQLYCRMCAEGMKTDHTDMKNVREELIKNINDYYTRNNGKSENVVKPENIIKDIEDTASQNRKNIKDYMENQAAIGLV